MTVGELIDKLNYYILDGELTGYEEVADSGLFRISGVSIVKTVSRQYVYLDSEEYRKAQIDERL